MYAFVRAWVGQGEVDRRWVRIMWLAWGLAFMTKGPPGLLPLLAMIVMLGFHDRRALARLFDPIGLATFAVVGFTWFAILIAQDPSRLGYFVGYEVYDRVFTSTHDRNAEWYAPLRRSSARCSCSARCPGGYWRWSPPGGRARPGRPSARSCGAGDRDLRLLAWWFLLPLAIFSLAQSRLQLYVLPLFVPLSLILARPLADWSWLEGRRLVVVAAVTAIALVVAEGRRGPREVGPRFPRHGARDRDGHRSAQRRRHRVRQHAAVLRAQRLPRHEDRGRADQRALAGTTRSSSPRRISARNSPAARRTSTRSRRARSRGSAKACCAARACSRNCSAISRPTATGSRSSPSGSNQSRALCSGRPDPARLRGNADREV